MNLMDVTDLTVKPAPLYRVVPKMDFGAGKGFLIKGEWVKRGFVVTDGICNVMPGAAWFLSIADALAAIPVYHEWKQSGAHSDVFWERLRALP